MPADLTTAEAAERLNLDRSAVIRLVRSGKLTPARKLPGHTGAYLFDADDIDRIITARKNGAAA